MPKLPHTLALLGGGAWKEGRIFRTCKTPTPNESAALSTWIEGSTSWAKEPLATSDSLLGPHVTHGTWPTTRDKMRGRNKECE